MKKLLLAFSFVAFGLLASAQNNEAPLDNKRFSMYWFSNLDKALANPDKVLYLDLSLQKLKVFPKEIFKLRNLKELYISYNYWPSIPNGFGALTQLETMDLSGNYFLNKLPDDLSDLKTLKELDLKDNKLNKGEVDRVRKMLPNCKVLDK